MAQKAQDHPWEQTRRCGKLSAHHSITRRSHKKRAEILLQTIKYRQKNIECSSLSLWTLDMVGVKGFEPSTSTSRRVAHLIFKWFLRLFGAFVSEINAFRCSRSHCFHTVQVCRWSKVWSTHFLNRQSKLKIFESRTVRRSNSSPCVEFFLLPLVYHTSGD